MKITVNKMGKKIKKELKKNHKAVSQVQHLSIEVLDILWSFHLLQKLSSESSSNDPLDNLRNLKFSELLINDIILRLCKFRDDDSRSLSFEQVFKSLRKRSVINFCIEDLDQVIKKYKSTTQNIENHRNTYIAHLSKRDRTHLKPTSEIYEAIQLAVEITDTLSGEQNSYDIVGIDLRKELIKERP